MPVPHYTLHTELLKEFLQRKYLFRRNCVTDEVEYLEQGNFVNNWQPLTKQVQNTITIKALSEGIEAWDKDVRRYLDSDIIMEYDPICSYIDALPKWNGKDYIGAFAMRVTQRNPHWVEDFHRWFLAMVSQWITPIPKHGNTMVPLLVGIQGNGKSTFCRMILPPELRPYYTDRIDFTSKKDAENMMTRFALINIDEYDSISKRQNAFLKHILQKTDVKNRKLYQTAIRASHRYASFIATTNDPTPLTDVTGSRRFLCIRTNAKINIKDSVNYPQMYSQAVHEIRNGACTWFTTKEEHRIQLNNTDFQTFDYLESAFTEQFDYPTEGMPTQELMTLEIIRMIKKKHPYINIDASVTQRLPKMLVRMGFPYRKTRTGRCFTVRVKTEKRDA